MYWFTRCSFTFFLVITSIDMLVTDPVSFPVPSAFSFIFHNLYGCLIFCEGIQMTLIQELHVQYMSKIALKSIPANCPHLVD